MVSRPGRRIVVAAAGYGKTTALRRWYPTGQARWWQHDTAPHLFVRDAARSGGHLVLDDLPPLPDPALRDLLRAVAELDEGTDVALASRHPLPWRRLGSADRWTETDPADLACTADEIDDLITEACGTPDPELAARLHKATAGWPALVHLAVESVHRHGDPGTPLGADEPLREHVLDHVLAELPPTAYRLLVQLEDRTPVSTGLAAALGHRDAADLVAHLRRTGLLVRTRRVVPGLPAAEHVVPVVAAAVATDRRGVSATTTARKAATWYDEHGPPAAAAREHLRAADPDRCARVLADHGDRIISAGQAGLTADLISRLPGPLRTPRLRTLLGDAQRTAGDLEAAAHTYTGVSGPDDTCTPGLAWRIGRIAYQRGDAQGALAAYARATPDATATEDTALLAAWTAHAHLLAGDVDLATATARRAVTQAAACGDGTALATAHLSVALCLAVAGDAAGSEEHFALALPVAQRTGDVLLLTRIHTNRTYQRLQAARYPEALTSAQLCVAYAQAAGSPSLHAIATSNEAEALAMLGRFPEAVRRYQAAIAHYQRHGSRRFAGAVLGLAELYRRRGWREQARAAYEQVVAVATGTGNAHVLVPALAGLALVLLADDVKAAAGHADAAAGHAGPQAAGPALLAQGWTALAEGTPGRPAELATEAARVARTNTDPAGLADALELRAAAETDPARARAALREAEAIWHQAGAAVEAARIAVLTGALPGTGTDERAAAAAAAQRLAAVDAIADRLGTGATATRPQVAVRALGRFEVEVAGQVPPPSQWQSRKARDLLRILVGRRGRPVPRSELCELLWPDGEPARTGHRLSVLLNILRGVLDPDRAQPADHFLLADTAAIALNLRAADVDVEDFLDHVAHARRLVEQERLGQAREILLAADTLHRAEAFEDEPYAEWAGPLREEVRAAHLAMLRMLAHTHRAAGQPGAAVACLLRLLERDPYDERAHRSLVRTLVAGGQHGEARRAFDRYAGAMREIGVRPPDRELLLPVRPTAPAR
ncbi:BTAD domain-containing putative transcriptional regulator [Catellatospora sp. KI3]|uniref:BTAD domain-containing putative transcriptional regulator n=1 Tax=Catellatospora sp. KI3 TaxID=3041620 RepID=UPI0024824C22|nr:BTAD domain-containing putative transcriptional regulator [Catellatospora sp. KI3]MDI1462913.1 BTAD domain-containing putative transcriptional regulator [Catellatospora sp. KI3]